MGTWRAWGAFVAVGILCAAGGAGTIYVNGVTGSDAWNGLCPAWNGGTCGPKRTIQAGIGVALEGDEVVLAPFTYTGDGNRDCDFLGKAITVRSVDPDEPLIVAWTVVDCEASIENWHRGFNFVSGESRDAVLAGVTIQNGCAPLNYSPPPVDSWAHEGGAISIKGSSPTIDRCVFMNNQAFGGGGGAIISNGVTSPNDAGAPLIVGCSFQTNVANGYAGYSGVGGAVDCDGGNPVIERCSFSENTGRNKGGAVFLWRCQAVIQDCEFRGNRVVSGSYAWGGALFLSSSTAQIRNCVLVGNYVRAGGTGGTLHVHPDMYSGGGACHVTLINCVLAGNRATYGGVFAVFPVPSFEATLHLANCTIVGNRAAAGSVLDWRHGAADIANCIIWNDIDWWGSGVCAVDYSNVQYGWPGTGNIDQPPLFVDYGHWDDNGTPDYEDDDFWVNGDYHLLAGSPGTDAGSNALLPRDSLDLDADGCLTERLPFDLGDLARRHDDPATPDTGFGGPPLVDMGAYEFGDSPPPNPAACDGDLNCDGVLDFDDINPFVLALSDPGSYQTQFPDCFLAAGDVNGDGAVDFDDINPFVGLLAGP